MSKFIDLTGQRFGRLTVIKRVEDYVSPNGLHRIMWLCQCDCENQKVINGSNLRRGITVSCGCNSREKAKKTLFKHGFTGSRIHRIWLGMKNRCLNPNYRKYHRYGGRGIMVCKEWQDDFMNFYNWSMNNGYADDLSIDRINNDGNYEPSNCRWATPKQQSRNTRRNRLVTINNETHCLSEWAEILGVDYDKFKKEVVKVL